MRPVANEHPSGRCKKSAAVSVEALDETLRLYNGWLAYLLKRLGEAALRVEAEELRVALDTLSCRVEREGSTYVIYMETGAREGEDHEREDRADGA